MYIFDAGGLDIQHSMGISTVEKLYQVEDPLGGSWSTHVYIKSLHPTTALTLMMETVIFLLRPFHFSFPRAPHSEETRRDAEG